MINLCSRNDEVKNDCGLCCVSLSTLRFALRPIQQINRRNNAGFQLKSTSVRRPAVSTAKQNMKNEIRTNIQTPAKKDKKRKTSCYAEQQNSCMFKYRLSMLLVL